MPSIAQALASLGLALALNGPAAQARAPEPANATAVLQALNTVRARGCAGAPGLAVNRKSFLLEPRLLAAAARVAGGQALAAALKASGYVAPRSAVISLRGYPGPQALAEAAAQHSCASVTEPAFREVGIHAQGDAVWIVLAEPFTPPPAAEASQVAAQVLARVNAARAQPRRCGDQAMAAAPPLGLNSRLSAAAQAHADDMARRSYFSHTGRDGSEVGTRATRSGYAWRQIGENIAAGQMRAEEAVDGWLKSPGHCVNLMRPQYTEMGLAYTVNLASENSIYWVQVFGTPR